MDIVAEGGGYVALSVRSIVCLFLRWITRKVVNKFLPICVK